MNQYAEIELTEEQVIKIIKNNLVENENSQAPNELDVTISYDEEEGEIITKIVKPTTIGGYKGFIKEDIDEEDTIGLLWRQFEDEDDYISDTYEIIYEDSIYNTNKKVFKGVRLRFDLLYSNESFVKEL